MKAVNLEEKNCLIRSTVYLIISYFLVGVISLNGLILLVGLTFFSYALSLAYERTKGKWLIGTGIVVVVGILIASRFFEFVENLGFVGLSFFSLHIIGYLIDVLRGTVSVEKNIVFYALFVAYFPTLLSGPVQRSKAFISQIHSGNLFSYNDCRVGLMRVAYGLFQKVAVADRLALMVDFAYGEYSVRSGATLLWGVFLYAFQLYFDFAGYSNIVIGISRLLGLDIGENFRQPYFSTSVKDFWQRWHISLSTWLRDYVYIPLGGNRKGTIRKYINLFLTFAISGVWHGKGLTFFAWGCLHGLYQVGYSIFGKKTAKRRISKVFGVAITFALVDFAWLFFRADSLFQGCVICKRILFNFALTETARGGGFLMGQSLAWMLWTLFPLLLVIIVDVLSERGISIFENVGKCHVAIRWMVYLIFPIVIALYWIQGYGISASNFIYSTF